VRVTQGRKRWSDRLADDLVGQIDLQLVHLFGEGGELRLARRVLEEQAEPVGLLAGGGQQRGEHEAAPLGPLDALAPLGRQPVGHLGEHGPVEVLLRVEVAVDDEPGDAGLGRDVVHRGAGETGAGEGGRRRGQDLGLTLVALHEPAGGAFGHMGILALVRCIRKRLQFEQAAHHHAGGPARPQGDTS